MIMPKNKIVIAQLIDVAIENLGEIANEMLFVGGSIVPLLFTSGDTYFRSTRDVDCVIDVEALVDYYEFTTKLKLIGFKEISEEDAPICRWHKNDCLIDVIPTTDIIGFTNSWYHAAFKYPVTYHVKGSMHIKVISAVYFIATKLEAFNNRGKNDFLASHDMEDIISIIECRPEIVDEIFSSDMIVKKFIVCQFKIFCNNPRFLIDIIGLCNPDPLDLDNVNKVQQRILKITAIKV